MSALASAGGEALAGWAAALIALAAALVAALGGLHLLFTFHGRRFHPRDAGLRERMAQAPLVLTRQTTLWRAWIGFNASHSLGALLFGAVYGHLALVQPELLRRSPFLLGLGLCTLLAYTGLAWRYWFRIPLRGLLLATALYGAALLLLARA